MQNVLIIHNTFGNKSDPHYKSRFAVMEQVEAVAESIKKLGFGFKIIPIKDLKNLTVVLSKQKEKIIFNLAEEFLCSIEQACFVPAVCSAFGKSCTGNNTATLLTAQDKIKSKALFKAFGLPCPAGITISKTDNINNVLTLKGLHIIKPAYTDASEGITAESVVKLPVDEKKAKKIIRNIHKIFNQPAIIEQYIPSRELNVSVLGINDEPKVLAIAEIDFSTFKNERPKIVDYNAKWHSHTFEYQNTPRILPAKLPENICKKVRQLAKDAFRIFGCQDYVRVDFRLDENNNPYILEINPNPDITPEAGFASALEYAKIPYHKFIEIIINNTKKRLEKI